MTILIQRQIRYFRNCPTMSVQAVIAGANTAIIKWSSWAGRALATDIRAIIVITTCVVLSGCSGGSVRHYIVDNKGHLQHVGTFSPVEDFKYQVARDAAFEANGGQPPHPCRTWREYWIKNGLHWSGAEQFGNREEVLAYIEAQRRARGLPPLLGKQGA